jgi:large subunit ribosomal protein L15
MRLDDLKPSPGSRRRRIRVGRGISAGRGKYAGRGIKGQGARAGGKKRHYFEGGQLPLVRRLPFKRGFTNIFRIEYQEVNVNVLEDRFEAGAVVTPAALAAAGIIRDENQPIALLGNGEITKALTVQAHRASKSAEEKVTAAGGSIQKLELLLIGAAATVKKPRKEDIAALRQQQK